MQFHLQIFLIKEQRYNSTDPLHLPVGLFFLLDWFTGLLTDFWAHSGLRTKSLACLRLSTASSPGTHGASIELQPLIGLARQLWSIRFFIQSKRSKGRLQSIKWVVSSLWENINYLIISQWTLFSHQDNVYARKFHLCNSKMSVHKAR